MPLVAAMAACLGCGDVAPRGTPAREAPARPAQGPPTRPAAAEPVDVSRPMASGRPAAAPRSVLAAVTTQRQATPAPADPSKERLVVDLAADDAARAERAQDQVLDALVQAFPDPHAAGKRCDPNSPGTPPGERMGGILLPTVTQVGGSFTRAGAAEVAFLIDHCSTGVGAPRTRRLLVLEAGVATFDHQLGTGEPFDEVLAASDLDGDGRAELLLTTSSFQDERSLVDLSVASLSGATLTVLGTWRAVEHCDPRHPERTSLALHVRMAGSAPVFRAERRSSRCMYPPSPPGR